MKPIGVRCLEYLTRFGLDESVLKDYKKCGALNCSCRVRGSDMAVVNKFIDSNDIDESWIDFVRRVEQELDINAFHILYNGNNSTFGKELVMMYTTPRVSEDFQYKEFTRGVIHTILLYPEEDFWTTDTTTYAVRYGAVIDVNFKDSFKKSKIKYPNGRKYKEEN